MPRRVDPHAQGGYVRATFIVACEDLAKLSPERAAQIIRRIVDLEDGMFAEYAGIVEHSPRAGGGIIPPIGGETGLRGNAQFVTLEEVDVLLEEKYKHESSKHRGPSYRAPTFLRPEVCAIVIGSREFLQTNVEYYLDRKPNPFRAHILLAARRICALTEASKAGKSHKNRTFCRIPEKGLLRVWGGNFDALWERANRQRLSTDQIFERLVEGVR